MSRSVSKVTSAVDFMRRSAAILRRIIGVPDYDIYLAHMAARHPDAVPLSAREFEVTRMNDRYSRPGSRCC